MSADRGTPEQKEQRRRVRQRVHELRRDLQAVKQSEPELIRDEENRLLWRLAEYLEWTGPITEPPRMVVRH